MLQDMPLNTSPLAGSSTHAVVKVLSMVLGVWLAVSSKSASLILAVANLPFNLFHSGCVNFSFKSFTLSAVGIGDAFRIASLALRLGVAVKALDTTLTSSLPDSTALLDGFFITLGVT